MLAPQIIILVVALLLIAFWFLKGQGPDKDRQGRSNLPALLLAVWLVSSAVFGGFFYTLRIAGFFDITIERAIFALVILVLLAGLFLGRIELQKNVSIEIVMGLFILVCLFSMLRTGFLPLGPEFPSPWFAFISGYLFPFAVFVYAKNYLSGEKEVSVIFHVLFFFGIYLALTSFFEFTGLRQFVFPRYIVDPLVSPLHLERARGPFLNSAFNGVGILIGFLCGVHLLQKKEGIGRGFYLAALTLFLPAVFFTQTRAIYLALIVAIVILLKWYKTEISKWKLMSLPVALALIFFIAVSPRLISPDRRAGGVYQVHEVSIRMALLERSFDFLKENPLTGIGLAQFIPVSVMTYRGRIPVVLEEVTPQFQHNHLLGLAAETGLPGFLLYLALIILILSRIRQLRGKLPDKGIVGDNLRIIILAVWVVYLINNFFLEPSVNLFCNAAAFLFAGLADGMYTRAAYADFALGERQREGSGRRAARMAGNHV